MRIVLFLDLDDTIFQTQPKCPPGATLQPVAYRRDGAPLSFMTAQQHTLLTTLSHMGTVIPTTARSFEAFRRVQLPFNHLAILDFGGVVLLPGGQLDPAWDAAIRPQALHLGPELQAIHATAERISAERQLGTYARVISDFDMPLYLVVKHHQGDSSQLMPLRDQLAATCDPGRFFIHCNDNNLSLVPRFLGKERAVRHVLQHHLGPEPVLTIGMGDSLTDASFLSLCDFSLLPRGCQLTRQWLANSEGA